MLPRTPPLRNPARSLTSRPVTEQPQIVGDGRDSMEEALRPRHEPDAIAAAIAAATHSADLGLSPARWGAIAFLLLLSLLFSLLDTTIVSTSLLETAGELGNFADSSWVMLAYLLTYMGFSIIFAKLSDIFGRLAILLLSWVLFTAFSIGCGLANTMPKLIIMRAFQGVGGAGLYSLPIVCLHEIVPPKNRQMIGAFISIILSISFVLGPILGGVIPHLNSWRLLYLINIPFGAACGFGLFLLYPRRARHRHHPRRLPGLELVQKIDFLGAFLLLSGSMLLVFAVQTAGSMKMAWGSSPIIAALAVSATCWVIFWGWEAFVSLRSGRIQPVFPLSLAGQRVYLACLVTTLMVGFCFMTAVVTLPERSQIVDGDNVMMAGVNLLPLLGAVAVGSFVAGPVSRQRNRTAFTLIIGTACMAIGAGVLTMLERLVHTARAAKYCAEVLLGLGSGLCLASATMMSTAQARGRGDLAVANGATAQTRVLGSALGLGVWTIIFNSQVQSQAGKLSMQLLPGQLDIIHRSPSNALALPEPARSTVRAIYATAFTDMMTILVVVAGGAFISSLCCYETSPPPVHPPLRTHPKRLPGSTGSSEHEMQDMHDGLRPGGGGDSDGRRGSDAASRRESMDVGRTPTMPRPILPR